MFKNKFVELLNVNFSVGNNVCVNALSAAIKLSCDYSCVCNAVIFADNLVNLGKLNAESSDFDLTVISSDKINLALICKANNVACDKAFRNRFHCNTGSFRMLLQSVRDG